MYRKRSPGTALALAWIATGCAASFQEGPPLADPSAVAERARQAGGTERPSQVRFRWEYADERGNLRGDGVARVNPPDRFRLDLFATEGSMSAVLVDDSLDTLGDLEDVRLPAPPFLYAMAGVFRPGAGAPDGGFERDGIEVLRYDAGEDGARWYYVRDARLVRVEERRDGRLRRRIELRWGEDATWPVEARYRDDVTPSRVRWALESVRSVDEPWSAEIYELDPAP